jgi:hypothetical protein
VPCRFVGIEARSVEMVSVAGLLERNERVRDAVSDTAGGASTRVAFRVAGPTALEVTVVATSPLEFVVRVWIVSPLASTPRVVAIRTGRPATEVPAPGW